MRLESAPSQRLGDSIQAEVERLEAANWSINPVVTAMRLRALVELSEALSTEQLLDLAAAVEARGDERALAS